jgi:pimeloyl-ACP methyl ester carboxylesterase
MNSLSYIYRPGKTVILFLHGLGLNKETGINFLLVPELNEYGILIPDILGHGKSGVLHADESYSFEGISKKISQLLEQLMIERYELVVHSIASFFIPFLHAWRPPEHIVLLEGNVTYGDAQWSTALHKMNELELSKYTTTLKMTARIVFSTHLKMPSPSLAITSYAQGFRNVESKALYNYATDALRLTESGIITELLRHYHDQIMYVIGESGTTSAETKQLLEKYKIKTFTSANAGHYPHIDQPVSVINEISVFLKKSKLET